MSPPRDPHTPQHAAAPAAVPGEPARRPRGWKQTPIDWPTALFVAAMHLGAVWGVVHLVLHFSWWTLLLGILWYLLCGLSITAGYHRLFSHRAYQASAPVRAALLAFGAAAWERSALDWCRQHRVHHRYTDEDADPYSVRHGFWWAHIGWVISQGTALPEVPPQTRDLESDVLVRLQARLWMPLAVVVGGLLPAAIGALWSDVLGAFLVAGCLRIVVMWHATYSVNSFAHRFGKRTYSVDDSPRDNPWVALAALGEGYHSFHHRFQADYRNGVRWFHFDPTKWLIWTLCRLRLVRRLKRVPMRKIRWARRETMRRHPRMMLEPSRQPRGAPTPPNETTP